MIQQNINKDLLPTKIRRNNDDVLKSKKPLHQSASVLQSPKPKPSTFRPSISSKALNSPPSRTQTSQTLASPFKPTKPSSFSTQALPTFSPAQPITHLSFKTFKPPPKTVPIDLAQELKLHRKTLKSLHVFKPLRFELDISFNKILAPETLRKFKAKLDGESDFEDDEVLGDKELVLGQQRIMDLGDLEFGDTDSPPEIEIPVTVRDNAFLLELHNFE